MTVSLADLIAQGESQTREFKKSLKLRRQALEALCAMVNADSSQGTVVFGVGPDGAVCGVEPGNIDAAQRSLSQAISDGFDPPMHFEIETAEHEGKRLLILTAERDRSVPYHEYDGRAWIRQGSEKRQLTLSEKDHIRRTRDRAFHPGPWKCDRCGSWVGQLISVTVTADGMQKNYNCSCGGQFWPCA
jgi:ATP-dependent DNA helicase RecG